MNNDPLFDSPENKALMVVCARKLIKNIGVGGVIWGVINTVIGAFAVLVSLINVGILLIGMIMLGAGIQALRRPSLGALLAETIMAALLFVWNLSMSILNAMAGLQFQPRGLIIPLIVAIAFANHCRKLGHLREKIATADPSTIKATQEACKAILKKKLKEEALVVQTSDGKCRAQLMDDRAFFIQNDYLRAFVGPKESVRSAVVKPGEKKLSLAFAHPLGKLTYKFDKVNTEKLNNWLAAGAEAATP
jgi:hypothetical protein